MLCILVVELACIRQRGWTTWGVANVNVLEYMTLYIQMILYCMHRTWNLHNPGLICPGSVLELKTAIKAFENSEVMAPWPPCMGVIDTRVSRVGTQISAQMLRMTWNFFAAPFLGKALLKTSRQLFPVGGMRAVALHGVSSGIPQPSPAAYWPILLALDWNTHRQRSLGCH